MTLTIVKHSLLEHYLTILRNRESSSDEFRRASQQVSKILAVAATRDLPTTEEAVDTPLEPYTGQSLAGRVIAVPILRAGLALVGTVSKLVPNLSIGYIGLQRDEESAEPTTYYIKLPENSTGATVLILDPMLATGGSALAALTLVKAVQPALIKLVCVVCAPEGVEAVEKAYPEIEIYTAALDRELNSAKYILPGLGDFGDRICGT